MTSRLRARVEHVSQLEHERDDPRRGYRELTACELVGEVLRRKIPHVLEDRKHELRSRIEPIVETVSVEMRVRDEV